MKNIILSFILLIVVQSNISAQVRKFIPKKGIEGIDLSIGQSNLDDVIQIFGEPEEVLVGRYIYQSIGLTFQIKPHDKNKIIRSIHIEAPFKGKTKEGIILGKSTMQDVFNIYNDNGCYSSGGRSSNPQDGITFYVKDKKIGHRCNYKGKIYRVELHEEERNGETSYRNYKFDDEPIKKQKERIVSILQKQPFNKKELDTYFKKELQNDEKIYGIKKRTLIARELDHDIVQEKKEIEVGNKKFILLLLSRNSKMLYTKFYNFSYKNQVFTERLDTLELNKIQELRNNKGLRDINLKELYDFPNQIYTYGMFCGILGSPPNKCNEMLDLVNNNNYDLLVNWSTSINPEIAAYGYTGLYFLKQKGYPIQISEKELFLIIPQKTTIINMCRGCYFGVKSSMKEELSDKKLLLHYKALKETGFLRG